MGKLSGCNFTQESPGFYLGSGSKLKIETATPSPVAELSTLTANGGPFSIEKAVNTAVILPASSSRDYNASLKIMAKLAKSSGHGWTEANYLRSVNLEAVGVDKNVLIIGPSSSLNMRAVSGLAAWQRCSRLRLVKAKSWALSLIHLAGHFLALQDSLSSPRLGKI